MSSARAPSRASPAPEATVNADTCGAFVHLLALGIPGLWLDRGDHGAFITYGIQPGPMLFQTHPTWSGADSPACMWAT